MKSTVATVSAFLVVLIAGGGVRAALHQVNVGNNFFSPSSLEIIQGDQVRWTRTAGTHTTTSGNSPNANGLWNATLNSSTPNFTRTFNSVGSFPYFCSFHDPSMAGSITVEAASGILDDPDEGAGVPSVFALRQNSPNPFNAATQIEYSIERDGQVELAVFNILGQHVATLFGGFQTAGTYTVIWDGRDSRGHEAPSGIYFARMLTPDVMMTRKMVLLR